MTQPPVHLPAGVRCLRAPNPGPMTLEGTNTWVIDGDGGVLVVDPGPLHEGHLRAVASAAGPRPWLALTHAHPDHAEGAEQLAQLTGGARPDAYDSRVQVLATPGHTVDSVCFVLPDAILTGDTVLGRGTTVLDLRAGGDLGDYLDTLRTLLALPDRMVLPGHGPVLPSLHAVTAQLLEHRLARLEQVRLARAAGAPDVDAVVAAVYPGLDPDLTFAAVLSTRAAWDYFSRRGD